ncbi:MAG TPA: hypothetical protein VH593_06000 [Ktedonobacteraceae bacterium]|jgi:hypothetical protein
MERLSGGCQYSMSQPDWQCLADGKSPEAKEDLEIVQQPARNVSLVSLVGVVTGEPVTVLFLLFKMEVI